MDLLLALSRKIKKSPGLVNSEFMSKYRKNKDRHVSQFQHRLGTEVSLLVTTLKTPVVITASDPHLLPAWSCSSHFIHLPQFARAAVCMQQVIVAPHNSAYMERIREKNLIYFMPTKQEVFYSNHFSFSNIFLLICGLFFFHSLQLNTSCVEANWGLSQHALGRRH